MVFSLQCPNPDFNKEHNRWRMVRRMLVEAVADLLQINGKVSCFPHLSISIAEHGYTLHIPLKHGNMILVTNLVLQN
jgi:hypothetical protein